jgi:hypothetical protein
MNPALGILGAGFLMETNNPRSKCKCRYKYTKALPNGAEKL